MQEYKNIFQREDIYFLGHDPLEHYRIQKRIIHAKEKYPHNTEKQREIVVGECTNYWPIEISDPVVIDYAGLQDCTKDALKDVYKEFYINILPSIDCIVKAFHYQGKIWLYWWDMYKNSALFKSGLEFFPWHGYPISYLIFATDFNQSPLMYTEPFEHVIQK